MIYNVYQGLGYSEKDKMDMPYNNGIFFRATDPRVKKQFNNSKDFYEEEAYKGKENDLFIYFGECRSSRPNSHNFLYEVHNAEPEEFTGVSTFSVYDAKEIIKKHSPLEYRLLNRVRIVETDLCPSACIFFDKFSRKFVMEINPNFVEQMKSMYHTKISSNVVGAMLIEHELQHMIRSHVNTGTKRSKYHELDNICEDLFINNDVSYISGYASYFPMGVFRALPIQGIAKKSVGFGSIFDIFRKKGLFQHTWDSSAFPIKYKKGEDVEFILHFTDRDAKDIALREAIVELQEKFLEMPEGCSQCGAPMDGGYIFSEEELQEGSAIREASLEELQEIVDKALSESTSREKSRGLGALCANVERPTVCMKGHTSTWRDVLRKHVRSGLNSKEVYKINSPNARVENQFGRDEDIPTIKHLAFAIDMSGSMGINDYQECIAEVESVVKALQLKQLKLTVIWWGSTAKVETFRSMQEFRNRCKKPTPSLGGTDPDHAIRELDKIKCDCQIIMTDGWFYGYREPKRKTLWFVTKEGTINNINKTKKAVVVKPD